MKPSPVIEVKFENEEAIEQYEGLFKPARDGDAGVDLRASKLAFVSNQLVTKIPTGVAIAIPAGAFALILPRSGQATKKAINIITGVIDSGYRGELEAMAYRVIPRPIGVKPGERIAQLVSVPVMPFIIVDEFSDPVTERGDQGFGSTD